MSQPFLIAAAALAALSLASAADAAVVTLAPSQDAMIFATSAGVDTGNASGKGPALFAGADGGGSRKRSLLKFDVSGIPANAAITDVTLTLHLGQIAGSGGGSSTGGNYPTRIFSLLANRQDWTEGNSGSPTSPNIGGTGQGFTRGAGDVTWDYASFDPANPASGRWNDGTADLGGGNFDPTPSATSTFTQPFTVGAPFAWTGAGLAEDVQSWVAGGASNFGWLLRGDNLENMPQSFLGFWSREGALANTAAGSDAPALRITYEIPIPEPTAAAGVLAGCAMARRRRAAR